MVQELSSNIIVIEKLQNFQYKDKNLRDHGENVRVYARPCQNCMTTALVTKQM